VADHRSSIEFEKSVQVDIRGKEARLSVSGLLRKLDIRPPSS